MWPAVGGVAGVNYQLESKMKEAAKNLDFEEAANLRDRIKQLH